MIVYGEDFELLMILQQVSHLWNFSDFLEHFFELLAIYAFKIQIYKTKAWVIFEVHNSILKIQETFTTYLHYETQITSPGVQTTSTRHPQGCKIVSLIVSDYTHPCSIKKDEGLVMIC